MDEGDGGDDDGEDRGGGAAGHGQHRPPLGPRDKITKPRLSVFAGSIQHGEHVDRPANIVRDLNETPVDVLHGLGNLAHRSRRSVGLLLNQPEHFDLML